MVILATGLATISTPLSNARAANPPTQNVYAYGRAGFYGSTGALALAQPMVGMAATPSGHGYWSVASDGGIFSFGDARFFGSTGALRLNRPIVGMAATPSGRGYWLVASDGGIFSFGDARFFGSTGALRLNRPIVGMAATPSGHGYWLVASDGGIFSFGDARFFGSTGALRLNRPIVGMAATPSGHGYWFVASDGGLFSFGDAGYHGSTAATDRARRPAGRRRWHAPSGAGYWLATPTAPQPASATPRLRAGQPTVPCRRRNARSASPPTRPTAATGSPLPRLTSNPKVEAAIAWFTAASGSTSTPGSASSRSSSRSDRLGVSDRRGPNWLAQPVKHLDWQNAEGRSSSGHERRPVTWRSAWETGASCRRASTARIGIVPTGYFQNPLGWAASPFL